MRRRLLLSTAIIGTAALALWGGAAAATWWHVAHGALAIEVGGATASTILAGLAGGSTAVAAYLRETGSDKVSARISAALLADPFLRDLIVRRLADALVAGGRTPDLRQAKQTSPFEVRPFGVVR